MRCYSFHENNGKSDLFTAYLHYTPRHCIILQVSGKYEVHTQLAYILVLVSGP